MSSTTTAHGTQASLPFRFLDLPKELRYMVYERIDFSTTKREFASTFCIGLVDLGIVSKTLSTSLLATSRFINAEAQPFFDSKLQLLRESERFHIISYIHATVSTIEDKPYDDRPLTDSSCTSIMRYIHQEFIDRTNAGSANYSPPSAYSFNAAGRAFYANMPEYESTRSFVEKFCDLLLGVQPRTVKIVLQFFGQTGPERRREVVERTKRGMQEGRLSMMLKGDVDLIDWEDYCGGSTEEELNRRLHLGRFPPIPRTW